MCSLGDKGVYGWLWTLHMYVYIYIYIQYIYSYIYHLHVHPFWYVLAIKSEKSSPFPSVRRDAESISGRHPGEQQLPLGDETWMKPDVLTFCS